MSCKIKNNILLKKYYIINFYPEYIIYEIEYFF